MQYLITISEIIGALTVIFGFLIGLEKATKGKLTKWIVKPVVEPLQKRMDELEEKNNMCKNNMIKEIQEIKIDNLKQIIMNETIPITERLEAGERYIKQGGNGAIKVFYNHLKQEYYDKLEEEEHSHGYKKVD